MASEQAKSSFDFDRSCRRCPRWMEPWTLSASAVEVTSPGHQIGSSSQTCRDPLEMPARFSSSVVKPVSGNEEVIALVQLQANSETSVDDLARYINPLL